MRHFLLSLVLSAIAVWLVSQILPGFRVDSAGAALMAALLIGVVNGTLGFVLKLLTLPLSIATFGLFLLVINALMIMLVSGIIPGFYVDGFLTAFIGGIVLSVLNVIVRALAGK